MDPRTIAPPPGTPHTLACVSPAQTINNTSCYALRNPNDIAACHSGLSAVEINQIQRYNALAFYSIIMTDR